MKIGVIADLHFGKSVDSSKDFDRDEETLIQFRRALEFLKSRVEGIVIAGDLSHTNYPSISTNTYVSKVLHLLDRVELPSLVFSGNHDYTHEGKHILQPFKANDWNNLMIVDRPCLWENMCIVPHIPRKFLGDVRSKEELSQKINEYYSEALRTFPSKILVTHAQLAGCSVSSGYVFETGTVELNSINSTVHLEMIIAGDIHKGQSYCGGGSVSIVYPGSLTQTDYGERNDVKGVAIVDTESFSAELFEIPGYTKYLHFDLEALKDIDAITTEQWNGILNFSILDPSKRELFLQKIYEKNPKSVRNIEVVDKMDLERVDVSEIVSQSHASQFEEYMHDLDFSEDSLLQRGLNIVTEVESDNR